MNKNAILWGLFVLLLIVLVNSAWFIVMQTDQAIVFQFRNVVQVIDKPGLHFKIPFIQDVEMFEKRVLIVEAPSEEIMMEEQKPLEVDAFARYHIVDPKLYFQRLRDEHIANDRLGSILNASVRSVFGTIKMADVLSPQRDDVMQKILEKVNDEVKDLGVEVVDVRIRRTDLPQKSSAAVFARMSSQRAQEAAQIRATGQQQATQIVADADRQATIILAEAQGQAEKLKGEGDQKALELISQAASQDSNFYVYWRSLSAYRTALNPDNTTYVINPDSEFFKFFGMGSK
jgi:membrane protease subunit HflC